MPRCECGMWLSADYIRVLLLDDVEETSECFACAGAGVRYGGSHESLH